jgi:L-threonylcarbamoyladenylate synthase
LLRPGRITAEQIAAVAGVLPELPGIRAGAPRVSGSLSAHYAPQTPLRLVATAQLPEVLRGLKENGKRFGLLAYGQLVGLAAPHALRLLPANAEGYARGVYAALRELDQAGNEVIVVEAVPPESAWAGVADRLRRAACGSGES